MHFPVPKLQTSTLSYDRNNSNSQKKSEIVFWFLGGLVVLILQERKKTMKINHKLLTRYFQGKSTDKEQNTIREWAESSHENWRMFVRERALYDAGILLGDIPGTSREHIHKLLRPLSLVAAAAMIIFCIFITRDNYSLRQKGQQLQRIAVPSGNRTNVTLPDGTNVWLSSKTSLSYPSSFTGPNREVLLDGEGYFEVVKSEKPFIVKTSKYNVEVLGTVFNVEAYSNSDRFVTNLYEGKVKIFKPEDEQVIFLSPGQTAENKDGSLIVTSTAGAEDYMWKDGLINLGDKSFSDIMSAFEKFFGVKIIIKNNDVIDQRYDGKLRMADGIEHALKVLQKDFPFIYEINEDEDTIIIK